MPKIFKKNSMILFSVIAAILILLSAFIANGSDYENAWLYLTVLWIVLIPLFEIYNKNRQKKKRS